MTTRPYFIVVRPEQINGKLAAREGKLLLNVLNYSELHVELPVLNDDALQVFEVVVDTELVRLQQEGDRQLHLLWSGEKHARSRPGELVTVEVRNLERTENELDPVEAAGVLFAGFPSNVRLSAVILNVADEDLAAAGMIPARARAWAQQQVAQPTAG